MTEDGDDKPKPGSVSEVTRRLLLWARRRIPVLLRVEFIDELAREQVVQNLKAELQNGKIPVHEIELPTDRPDDLAQWLVEELEKLPPGVASINGFAIALPEKDPERQRALYALNLRREVFASFPLCQIWWMPQHIIEMFAGRISDLNSWFRLRASLTQQVPAVAGEPSGLIQSDMTTQSFGLERVTGLSQNERNSRVKELKGLLLEIQAAPEDQRDFAHEKRLLIALAEILHVQAQYKEEEPLLLRLLTIDEASLGKDHPNVARDLNNLAQLYKATNRLKEAEPLMQRALKIEEASFGKDHPNVATDLNNLAQLYEATNRFKEAEPLMERHLVIFLQFTRRTGHPHPHLDDAIKNYSALLMEMGHSRNEVNDRLKRLAPEMFESTDKQIKEE